MSGIIHLQSEYFDTIVGFTDKIMLFQVVSQIDSLINSLTDSLKYLILNRTTVGSSAITDIAPDAFLIVCSRRLFFHIFTMIRRYKPL